MATRSIFSWLKGTKQSRTPPRQRRSSVRLTLEALEDRVVPAKAVPAGFAVDQLFSIVESATDAVKQKLSHVKKDTNVSIADMFEMQTLMNHLSQLSEMSTSVVDVHGAQSAINAMAINIRS